MRIVKVLVATTVALSSPGAASLASGLFAGLDEDASAVEQNERGPGSELDRSLQDDAQGNFFFGCFLFCFDFCISANEGRYEMESVNLFGFIWYMITGRYLGNCGDACENLCPNDGQVSDDGRTCVCSDPRTVALEEIRRGHFLLDDAELPIQILPVGGTASFLSATVTANGGREYALSGLTEFSVRATDGYQSIVDGEQVGIAPLNSFWKGIDEATGASIFLIWDKIGERVTFVNIQDGSNGETSLLAVPQFGEGAMAAISFNDYDIDLINNMFGYDGGAVDENRRLPIIILNDEDTKAETWSYRKLEECSSLDVLHLVIEYDKAFCAKYKGKENADSKVEAIVAKASLWYEVSGLCLTLRVLRKEGTCTKDNFYTSSNIEGVLAQFQAYFGAKAKDDTVAVAAAHLFIGQVFSRSGDVDLIGAAFNGRTCDPDGYYGANSITFSDSLTFQASLFAHELAHNNGQQGHVGGAEENTGHIMNALINDGRNGFSDFSIFQMNQYLEFQKCLACSPDSRRKLQGSCTVPPTVGPAPAPIPAPNPIPVPSPPSGPTPPVAPWNSGYITGVFGDPHISTFDRLRFSCQATGEFTMATSLETSEFLIQERFTKVGSGVCSQASVSTGIVVRDVDYPTLQLSIPSEETSGEENVCPVDFFVDGNLTDMADGTGSNQVTLAITGGRILLSYLSGIQVAVTLRRSGSFGCFFVAQVYLPYEYRQGETILGLYGKPNGNRADDWVAADGNTYVPPQTEDDSVFELSYRYCIENWCVKEPSGSIFTYKEGESFASLSSCDDNYSNDLEAAVAAASDELKAVCGGDRFCLVDGICGDVNDAINALEDEHEVERAQDEVGPQAWELFWAGGGLTGFGIYSAISGDGNVAVVSDILFDSGSGGVRIYRVNDRQRLLVDSGSVPNDRLGRSVAVSKDGSLVAVSSNSAIFLYREPAWDRTEIPSVGSLVNYVALSGDGLTLGVGSWGEDGKGKAQTYFYDKGLSSWQPFGQILEGDFEGDRFGKSVALNWNGTILAVGAPRNTDTSLPGYARVYRGGVGFQWEKIGPDINGTIPSDRFGYVMSMSDTGGEVAIGADQVDTGNGYVAVYQLAETSDEDWVPQGEVLPGFRNRDRFGFSVSLTGNARLLAIGAPNYDEPVTGSGLAAVYQEIEGDWVQLGSILPLDGTGRNTLSGTSVSLADDGKTVLVGSQSAGFRVYKLVPAST